MTDILVDHLENLILWIQNNPVTTVIIAAIIIVALIFIGSVISWIKD